MSAEQIELQNESELENLNEKHRVFANFCIAMNNAELYKFLNGSGIRDDEKRQKAVVKSFNERDEITDRIFSILEDSNIPFKVKLVESSNYIKTFSRYKLQDFTDRYVPQKDIKDLIIKYYSGWFS